MGGRGGRPYHITPGSSPSPPQFVVSLVVDEAAAQPTGVLVPVPGPPLHRAVVGLAGAVAVPYPLAEEQGWGVDGETVRRALRRARARCHPKVFCVVNPGDPTGEFLGGGGVWRCCASVSPTRGGNEWGLPVAGHVLSRQNMEDIIRLAAEENLLLLADEVGAGRGWGGVCAPHPGFP